MSHRYQAGSVYWKLLIVGVCGLGVLLNAAPLEAQVPRDASLSFLETREVKLGVDLNRGGAIVFFAEQDGKNRVNNFDRGRQVQLSFFSGPIPYEQGKQRPADHWKHLGWNPVQAGDDFGYKPKVIQHSNDGKTMYTKLQPLQWPLQKVAANCFFETWIQLEGRVAKVRARFTNFRKDKTQYPARLQELPAVYCNANFSKLVSYTGSQPFQNQPIQVVPKSTSSHPWAFWQGTECWSAAIDPKTQRGVGLITPHRTFFTGGFAGRPGPNDTLANSCAYLAGQRLEVIDHNLVYEYEFEMVAGDIDQIRARAKNMRRKDLPSWTFEKDRQGWHLVHALDQGWPIQNGWRLKLERDDPQLVSPFSFWQANEAPVVEIECAMTTQSQTATLYWQRHGQKHIDGKNFLNFKIQNDGQVHRYRVNLSKAKNYQGGIIRLRLDPGPGATGDSATIKSLRLLKK